MKQLITLLLVLILVCAPLSWGSAEMDPHEYTPGLSMSIQEFIDKYNMIPSSLTSPYLALTKPDEWVKSDGYNVAWFHAAQDSDVRIMLMSLDIESGQQLKAGLDAVRIYNFRAKDYVSFISVAVRCTSLFAYDIAGTSTALYNVTDTIKYYYENVNDIFASAVTTINQEKPVELLFKDLRSESYFEIRTK